MNLYRQMKERHQEESNALPIKFAFNKEQLESGMRELGLEPTDTKKVVSIGYGGFCLKTDLDMIRNTYKRHKAEQDAAVLADPDGTGFVKDMFKEELRNHEYTYTLDPTDAVEALGYDMEQVDNSPKLSNALEMACRELRAAEDFDW